MKTRLLALALVAGVGLRAAELPALIGPPNADGTVDLNLFIQKVEPGAAGEIVVTALARDGDADVSFQLVLPTKWKTAPALPGASTTEKLYLGTAIFRSTGETTAALVQAMARAFRVKAPKFELGDVSVSVIAEGVNPAQMATTPLRMKFIHGALGERDPQKADRYAELFCLLDVPNRWVQLQESRISYRKAVVGLFSRAAPPVRVWSLPPMPDAPPPLVVPGSRISGFNPPHYPEREQREGTPGEVLVELSIDAAGRVATWKVVRATTPGYAKSVERTFRKPPKFESVPEGTYSWSFVFCGYDRPPDAPDRPGTLWIAAESFGRQ